ncbi:Oxysterol-binding [Neolecta irregularis DAH-3]|uniref:Oxysterol-binding n=1 Tax=Neolecta irregularis (strain DAH-3) TaxID=1198029 RepID=A0A1U7LPW9_NEOID|nr:Oxysterol-binding [Neolecta irregularis DAH-3]|eukprot:OLL24592.1 Oxysterol-binding [Neolecta irregularis DAH-3]
MRHFFGSASSTSPTKDKVDAGPDVDELEEDGKVVSTQGIILMYPEYHPRDHYPGMDLTRVTLPTFVLEPKSMLERITNFMCHPDLLLHIPSIDDPVARFVEVIRFYMSGWYLRPKGAKKPLNPVLGEHFSCKWIFHDGSAAFYLSEQVSHHPPISAYFYMAPKQGIRIDGCLVPKSRFLGNSAATIMEGKAYMSFNQYPGELYAISQPNVYARGILFGRMRLEFGDSVMVECEKTDLIANIEFKTKGFISGTYDAISGKIQRKSTGDVLFELSGKWSDQLYIKDTQNGGERELLFDTTTAVASPPIVRLEEEQEERESRRLWKAVTSAIIARDQVTATDAKGAIEDRQREESRTREAEGIDWEPRFFVRQDNNDYTLRHKIISTDPKAVSKEIENIIGISSHSQLHRFHPCKNKHGKTSSSDLSVCMMDDGVGKMSLHS